MAITEIAPGLFIHTSHIYETQSVIAFSDNTTLVFDPNYFDDEIRAVREFAEAGQTNAASPLVSAGATREKYLVLTHSDFDHIAGVPYFADYPVLTAESWDTANEQRAIQYIERFDSEFYIPRPWSGQMDSIRISRQFSDGEEWKGFTFYHAKGHTGDGLVTVRRDWAVVGDYLSGLEFPFMYTSYRDYLATLAKFRTLVEQHNLQLVVSMHGKPAESRAEITRRIDLSEDYVRRVEAVAKAAQADGADAEEAVRRGTDFLYDGKPIAVGIRHYHENNIRLVCKENGMN